MNGSDGLTDVR